MISALHIRNLALVAELDIEFGAGLNVVTGETGAGKSLVLGAIKLLLGGRGGSGVIRTGTDRCEIAATVSLDGTHENVAREIAGLLQEAGAPPCEGGQLLIRRVLLTSIMTVKMKSWRDMHS